MDKLTLNKLRMSNIEVIKEENALLKQELANTNKIVLNLKEKVSKFKQNLNNRDNIIYKLEVNVNILNIVMISTIIILIYNERNRSWF